jgi:HlyD family secretion protein
MHTRRLLAWIALGLLVVTGLVYGFVPRPVAVDLVPVARGPLTVTIEEEGRTRVIDRFILSAPVAGFARRVELDVGDPISRGDRVLILEPLRSDVLDPRRRAEAEARVSGARAALQGAQQRVAAADADAEFTGAELARKERLRADRTISEDELDRARASARAAAATLRSAEFAVDVARHELEAAQTALEYSAALGAGDAPETVSVIAPVSGRVLRLVRESEGVVAAGEPLLEIGDPRALEVEVDVLSADAVKLAPGTRVRLLRWGGAEPLDAVVRVVEPTGFTKISALGVEEQRVLVISDIVSPPEAWERLGDGYRVEAEFILWHDDDVLEIPSSAMFRTGVGWAVYVMEAGRARLRSVQAGRQAGLETQILAGLEPGEQVIIHPSDEVGEGRRVRPR